MTCALLIPPAGLMELYNYDITGIQVLADKGLAEGAVLLNLATDGVDIGTAVFNVVVDAPRNERAEAAVHALIGAWVQMEGPVVISGLTEQAAIEIMRDVVV